MIVIVALAAALAQSDVLLDRTLAIVGGRTITLSDARTVLALGLAEGSAVDRALLDRLIDRELMLREADRYGPPEPAATAVEERRAEIGRRVGTADELARVLRAGGFSESRLRAWIRDDLRVASYLRQRFAADDRRQELVADWIADLRRRTDITVFDP